MNRQFFTLMTVFLMLGTLWGKAATQTITPKEISNPTQLTNGQYYLIGTDNYFLKANQVEIDEQTYTTLSTTATTISALTIQELDAVLWKVTAAYEEGGTIPIGCKLTNKKTGEYLTFDNDGNILKSTSTVTAPKTTFDWYPSNKYQGDWKRLKIANLDMSINMNNEVVSITKEENATELKVFTTSLIRMDAQGLNEQLGNGFILEAKNKPNIDGTPLLGSRLIAISFTVEETGDNAITGSDLTTAKKIATQVEGNNAIYFIYDGFSKFKENGITVGSNYTININKDNAEDVFNAFNKIKFIVISNSYSPDVNEINRKPGLYRVFAYKTGEDLLENSAAVSYLNALFKIQYPTSSSTVNASENLEITLPNAKFGADQISVRPFLNTNDYVISIPNEAEYNGFNTNFRFSSVGGVVSETEFVDKKYSITIADKEIIYYKDNDPSKDSYSTNRLNGWTFHPKGIAYNSQSSSNKELVSFEETSDILPGRPEGQWVVLNEEVTSGVTTEKHFVLYNRETACKIDLGKTIYKVPNSNGLYYIKSQALKGVRNSGKNDDNVYYIDTLQFTQQSTANFSGYASSESDKRFDPISLKSRAYRLGIKNGSFSGVAYISDPGSLTTPLPVDIKKEDGLYFYIIPVDTLSYGIMHPNSEVGAKNADNNYGYKSNKKDPIDNLQRIEYVLQEVNTKRYVVYNDDAYSDAFLLDPEEYCNTCSDKEARALKYAERFYLKDRGNGQYVLLRSEWKWNSSYTERVEKTNDVRYKVIGNISGAKLSTINMYAQTVGDLFTLDYDDSYSKFEDIFTKFLGRNDTSLVKINLLSVQNNWGGNWSDKNCYMLTPGHYNFLMEGYPRPEINLKASLTDSLAQGGSFHDSIGFSIIVDTAYVRRAGVSMPMYYLGMSSHNKDENLTHGDTIRPLHPDGHDAQGHHYVCEHWGLRETSKGNILFAMDDSIKYAIDNKIRQIDYCYLYQNAYNPRLRFVHARHIGDTIVISSLNRAATKDSILAGKITSTNIDYRQSEWLAPQLKNYPGTNGRPNYGLFAFESNPTPTNSERPEYAIYNVATRQYVSYINGNVVLTDKPSWYIIDISNKKEGHFIVGNEEALTSEVRIISGTGKVSIQKAAGKQVVITNAIGKTLANTTLTSDNAEIAVPQGIIFVNVEGEKTAAKVIIK